MTEPYSAPARIPDVRILPFLLGLEPTPPVVFQCGRRCAFLACNEKRLQRARSADIKVPGQEPERITADVSWAIDFFKGWSVIAVSRKTLQARSEQALVVIILSTGALIAYLGLALSRI
ncbi:hypothetical protein ACVILK_001010 [Bradyrhizobium embrapense]